jgi:hypothetical protein
MELLRSQEVCDYDNAESIECAAWSGSLKSCHITYPLGMDCGEELCAFASYKICVMFYFILSCS